MCYHASITVSKDVLGLRFNAKFNPAQEYIPHYHANGFANPGLPIITNEHPDEISIAEWALIPHFARTDADKKKYRLGTLNAKAETAFELSSFKKPIREKRCIILADGIYESMTVDGKKYPFYIYRKDKQPFAFAGIYSNWKSPDGHWIQSFSIMTTTPNALFSIIHNEKQRMPVILPQEKERVWLRKDLLPEEINDLMVPLENGLFTAHPVDKRLNQAKVFTDEPWIQEACKYEELAHLNMEKLFAEADAI